MAVISIRGFGGTGVVSDIPAWDVPDGGFTDAINMNFRDGSAVKALGYQAQIPVIEEPVWMQLWNDGDANRLVYATHTELYQLDGTAWTEVGGPYADTYNWQSFPFGNYCIFNNAVDVPQTKGNGDLTFSDLTGWPAGWQAGLIRPYKDFLVAAQVVDNGIEQRNAIFWSDAAPTNELPPNWDPTGPQSLSGFISIPADGGEVVEMVPLGDSLIVYTVVGCYALSFTGNADAPMTLRRLSIAGGCAHRESAVYFKSQNFVVGLSRIYLHDSVTKTYIAESTVESRFYSEVRDISLVRCVVDNRHSEIIIYYPATEGAGNNCDKALIWNWAYNTWTFRDLPFVPCISFAFVPTVAPTWDDLPVSWESMSQRWSELRGSAESLGLYYLSAGDLQLYQAELSFLAGGQTFIGQLVRTGIDLDTLTGLPTSTRKMIRFIYPQMDGAGKVNFYVGSTNAPGGNILWKGPIELDLDVVPHQYRIDAVIHGRYLAFRIDHSVAGSFRLSGMDIDVVDSYSR